ncbi:MAG TPA: class II glutamine amidotransferase [Dongiaceae bacterium]|nr:class II glutamine amidotransferase [Dongiaceae bacterium]
MCQLFGMNSANPVSPRFSLEGFFQRGGGTGEHADGWGLAYYNGHDSQLTVRETSSFSCPQARALVARSFKSRNVIAHVRKATVGSVNRMNSHPFVRRLWGRDWTFAHNGHLKDYPQHRHHRYNPVGETDSEWAFCWILASLYDHFGEQCPGPAALHAHLSGVSEIIARFGTFNFLLTDGEILIASCSTDLHWVQRRPPFSGAVLLDCEHIMDAVEFHDADDSVVLVATQPLTRGEDWQVMAPGELKLFQHGQALPVWLPGLELDAQVLRQA